MKPWIHRFGFALTVGSFVFFGSYLWKHSGQLSGFAPSLSSLPSLAGLILLQISVAIFCALAWRWIISFSGAAPFSSARAISIFCKAQFSKYIPGNVAHHIGRLTLAKQEGLSTKRGTLSQTIELLWNLGCAGALAVYGIGQLVTEKTQILGPLASPTAFLAIAAIAIIGPIILFPPALSFIKRKLPQRIPQEAKLQITFAKSLVCMLAYLSSFLFLGIALNVIAVSLLQQEAINLATASSICALAWVVGFVTPGSPAGIGIRDTIMLLALSPYYGAEIAGALTVAHRLLTAIGDLFVYLFGLAVDRQSKARD